MDETAEQRARRQALEIATSVQVAGGHSTIHMDAHGWTLMLWTGLVPLAERVVQGIDPDWYRKHARASVWTTGHHWFGAGLVRGQPPIAVAPWWTAESGPLPVEEVEP